ncbi:MAG: cytochrome P450 [Deltaproteobacteria bacterium]|nr:cytochrome P450 [Nannocystaceae bacterium]
MPTPAATLDSARATPREPPRIAPRHPLGVWPQLREDPVKFLIGAARDHGDVVAFRIGPIQAVLLRDPEAIKHVMVDNNHNYDKATRGYDVLRRFLGNGLLTSEGDFWRRQRRIAQPAFHRKRIAAFAETMVADTLDMLDAWEPIASQGRTIDMSHEMMALTLRIVGKTLLSTDVQDAADQVGAAVTTLNLWADAALDSILPIGFPTPSSQRANAAGKRLDAVIGKIIAQRRAGEPGEDLLGMLMSTKDAETGESMTDKQLRDEVMTIFLAGHETTANALSWLFYLLSTHPEVERRVRAELDEVLGARPPALDDLGKLQYLTMVIKEAMRLYPPAWIIDRHAIGEDEVLGYRIRKNSLVLLSPYVTHRHPGLWPNPEGFDPLRFTPEAEESRARYAYFPFGGGPRQCIGNGFAMMEAQLIVAAVLQRFRPWLVPGHPVELGPLITLRPAHGLKMGITRVPSPVLAAE